MCGSIMAVVIFQVMQCGPAGPIEFLDNTHSKVGVVTRPLK